MSSSQEILIEQREDRSINAIVYEAKVNGVVRATSIIDLQEFEQSSHHHRQLLKENAFVKARQLAQSFLDNDEKERQFRQSVLDNDETGQQTAHPQKDPMMSKVFELMDAMHAGDYEWKNVEFALTARELSVLLMAAVIAGRRRRPDSLAGLELDGFEDEFIGLAYQIRTRLEEFRRDVER